MNLTTFLHRIRTRGVMRAALPALLFTMASGAIAQSVTVSGATAGNGTYSTLGAAFSAINAGTQTGTDNIVVEILGSTIEAGPCVLNTNTWGTLTVRPGVDGVTVSGATATGRGLVELNGADNVTINGDNPNSGGINRNLTFTNTAVNTTTYTSVIRIATVATTNTSADGNSVRNCILVGSATGRNTAAATSTTGSENTTFGIYAGGNGAAPPAAPTALTSVTANTAPSGTTINNLTITNNTFDACARGIGFLGAAASVHAGTLTITNNVIGGAGTLNPTAFPFTTPTTTVYTQGIYIAGATSLSITGNTIRNILSYVAAVSTGINMPSVMGAGTKVIDNNTINGLANNGSSGCLGISMASNTGGTYSISRNTITNIQNNASSSLAGISVTSSSATSATVEGNSISTIYARSTGGYSARGILLSAGSNITVQNNFVWDINMCPNNSATTTSFGAIGIRITSGTGHKVYHNTVSLAGPVFTSTNTDVTACFSLTSTTLTGVDVRNNVFSNTMTGGSATTPHMCIQLPTGGTSAMNLTMNNNALYQGGGALSVILGTTSPVYYTAANFSAGAITPSTNMRAYTSTLSAAGTNDNASFATTAAAPFVSASDLHITGTPAEINNTGASIGVLTDIDGNFRTTPPDIGADEFTVAPCGAPVATAATQQNCGSSNFFINVTVTNLSGAPSVDIVSDYSGNPGAQLGVTTSGTYQIGPFASNSNVAVSVLHNGNHTCDASIGTYNYNCAFFGQNALDFDGVNDRVDCGNGATVSLPGTALTLEAWIYPTAWKASAFQGSIINKEGPNVGYMLRCGNNGQLSFALGNGSTIPECLSSTGALSLNTWQHVAATYDGVTMRIFRDGVQIGSLANTASTTNSATQLTIGDYAVTPGSRVFQGKIDEVRIWGVALPQAVLAANMNSEYCGNEADLRAYYRFNQGLENANNAAVTTLTDITANANTGTLVNFALNGTTSNWVPGKTGLTACVACAAAPTAGSISGASTACTVGTSPTLTLTGATSGLGISYQWSYGPVGSPFTNLLGTANTQSTAAIPLGAWEVAVTVTCAGFGSTNTAAFAFTRYQTPVATANYVTPACTGGALDLVGGSDVPGSTFAWTGPNAFTSAIQNPTVSASATLGMSGTYSVIASSNGCASTAATVTVTVGSSPSVSIDPPVVALCPSSSATLTLQTTANAPLSTVLSAVAGSAATVLATIPNPSGFALDNGATATSIFDGCNDMYDTGNLLNTNLGSALPYTNGTITANAAWGTGGQYVTGMIGTAACGTAPAMFLMAADANGISSFSITGNNGADGSGTQNLYSFTVVGGGITYTALVKRVFGATDPSINHLVLIPGANVATQTMGTTTDDDQHNILNLAGVTRIYYALYSSASGGLINDVQTQAIAQALVNAIPTSLITWPGTVSWAPNGETTPVITVSVEDTYTATATAGNGCVAQVSRTVTMASPLAGASFSPASPAYCAGGSVVLTATPTAGSPPYTYQWFDPSSNPAGTSQTQTVNLPGVWTVDITDNCGVSVNGIASPAVVENPLPTASATSNTPCTGQALNFDGSSDIGTTFTWTGPAGFSSTLEDPSIASPTTANSGNYIFTAFSAAGCSSSPFTLPINVNFAPVVSTPTATPSTICTGGSSQLNVSASIPGYTVAPITYAPVSGTGTAGPTGDDVLGGPYAIGFPFTFYGNTFTNLYISTNGFVSFDAGAGSGCCSGQNLPNATAPNNVIALGWEDYNTAYGGSIDYFTLSSPSRFVVRYNNLGRHLGTGTLDGQIVLFADGTIEMHIGNNNTTAGDITTQGIENATGTLATVVTGRNAASYNITSDGQRFTPNQATLVWSPNTFLSNATISNPVATNVSTTTTYSVTASANGCTVVTPTVTLTVDPPPAADVTVVPDCENEAWYLSFDVTSAGSGSTVSFRYSVNGGAPVTIGPYIVGSVIPNIGPYTANDHVNVTLVHESNTACDVPYGDFWTTCPYIITCPTTLPLSHCYGNQDTRTFWFHTDTPGETVTVSFISGSMAPGDVIRAYSGTDNTGDPIDGVPSSEGNLTGFFLDLSGATGTSTGQDLFIEIDSDNSNSCADSQQATWLIEAECTAGCVDPSASITTVPDCANQQFSIDVEVLFAGDASTTTLEYTVNAGTPQLIPGLFDFDIQTIGPFSLGDQVQIRLLHETDAACDHNFGFFTVSPTSCPNDEPCDARPVTVNPDYTCTATTAGLMTGATLTTGITGACTGVVQDQWFRFVATAPTHRVQLGGTTTGLSYALFSASSCAGPFTLVTSSGCNAGASVTNMNGLSIGQTYYLRVSRTTTGTNAYTVCVSAPPAADIGQNALSFDGTDDRVNCGTASGIDITGNTITLEAWIYPTAWRTNSWQGNIINRELPGFGGYMLRCGANGSLSFNLGNGTNWMEVISATNALTLNTWQHVAGTYDGTTLRIYRDGVLLTPASTAGTALPIISATAAQPLTIGNWSQDNTRGFVGKIDEVRIWNTTLSQATLAANLNQQLCGGEVGLRAYYNFNQGVDGANNAGITTLPDVNGTNNTGTLVNFALNGPTSNWVQGKTGMLPCPPCAAAPVAGTVSGTATVCSGVSHSLTLSGATTGTGITYQWYYGPVGNATQNLLGTGLTQSTASIPAGSWELQVDVTCSSFGTASTPVFAFSKVQTPAVTASAGPACLGQPLALTGTNDVGTTLAWTGPNGFTSNQLSPTVSPSATFAMSGVYSLTATANGCTSPAASATVVVNESPIVTITPPVVMVCPSGSQTLTASTVATASLEAVLSAINANSATLVASIPTPSGFTDGTSGNNIGDGCNDMYDGANFINSNLGTQLAYSNNTVISSAAMGSGGRYFTSVIGTNTCTTASATIFYWVGDINGVSSVSITGNLGADGGGSQNSTSFTVSANGVNYTVFCSRVFGAGDPSINHLFFIPQPNGASQTLGNTADENHVISGLAGSNRFYYMLFAGAAGVQYTDPQVTAIAQTFVNALPSATPSYVWSPGGETTSSISVNTAGTYTVTATLNGCSAQASRIVTEAPPFTSVSIAPANPAFCAGGSVTLTATPDDGGLPYTYQWKRPDNSLAGTASTQAADVAGVWTVEVTDNCGTLVTQASATVVEQAVPTASASASTACTGYTLQLTGTTDIGTSYAWTGPNGFSSTLQNPTLGPLTAGMSGTYSFIASTATCSSAPGTVAVNVQASPTGVTANASQAAVCVGSQVNLTSSGSIIATALSQDFNGTPIGWTTTNNSTGGTPANAAWTLRPSGFNTGGSWNEVLTSNDASQFYLTNSDAQGSGSTANTVLTSPVFSLVGYSSATLAFFHYYRDIADAGDNGFVEVSTDGNTWTTLTTFTANTGTASAFAPGSVNLNAQAGQATVQVRFRYQGTWDWGWAVDNVIVSGQQPATFAWTSVPTGFTSSAQNPTGVTVSTTTTYTVTASSPNGCEAQASVTVTGNPLPTVDCGGPYGPYCVNDADVTLSGSPVGGTWSGTGVTAGGVFDPSAGTQTLTYSYTDGNGCSGSCQVTIAVLTADTDGDGIADCSDNCPNLFGQIGDACDAGPSFVLGQIDGNCTCIGVSCTTNIDVVFQPDGISNIGWELRTQGTNLLVQSGSGVYPASPGYNLATCLPDGCYYLVVTDDGGDGIAGGGYQLRLNSGARLIDNLRDAFGNGGFTTGSVSQLANGEGFCLPLGQDRLIFTSCDKLDWKTSPCDGEYVVANDNAAVTAQYGVSNATSGYQMWWFDPNGGYSFKRFQSHSTTNGLPASATRACHFRINGWSGNQLAQGVLYNVKVRGRVNGSFLPWGPACRLMLDNAAAQCPRTKLMDIPNNQFLSCGQMRDVGATVYVHARPVRRMNSACSWVNANRYQFRFRIPAESFVLVKTASTYFVNTTGLACGKTYEVDVRASFDNGATWCAAGGAGLNDPAWGDVCLLTTTNCLTGGGQSIALQGNGVNGALTMYPNPNRGDQLFINLTQVEDGVNTVSVDIYDGFGKRVAARTIAVQDGYVNTVLELNGEFATGMYLVNITAGSTVHTERLVIQP